MSNTAERLYELYGKGKQPSESVVKAFRQLPEFLGFSCRPSEEREGRWVRQPMWETVEFPRAVMGVSPCISEDLFEKVCRVELDRITHACKDPKTGNVRPLGCIQETLQKRYSRAFPEKVQGYAKEVCFASINAQICNFPGSTYDTWYISINPFDFLRMSGDSCNRSLLYPLGTFFRSCHSIDSDSGYSAGNLQLMACVMDYELDEGGIPFLLCSTHGGQRSKVGDLPCIHRRALGVFYPETGVFQVVGRIYPDPTCGIKEELMSSIMRWPMFNSLIADAFTEEFCYFGYDDTSSYGAYIGKIGSDDEDVIQDSYAHMRCKRLATHASLDELVDLRDAMLSTLQANCSSKFRFSCDECGERDAYKAVYYDSGLSSFVCEECLASVYCTCSGCKATIARDDSYFGNGYWYCSDCVDNYRCSGCGEIFGAGCLYSGLDGCFYCDNCLSEKFPPCPWCGVQVDLEDCVEVQVRSHVSINRLPMHACCAEQCAVQCEDCGLLVAVDQRINTSPSLVRAIEVVNASRYTSVSDAVQTYRVITGDSPVLTPDGTVVLPVSPGKYLCGCCARDRVEAQEAAEEKEAE